MSAWSRRRYLGFSFPREDGVSMVKRELLSCTEEIATANLNCVVGTTVSQRVRRWPANLAVPIVISAGDLFQS